MKNIKLTVNRMHIRFEDDYFSTGETKQWEPFTLGVVVDRFEVATTDCLWSFESLLKQAFARVQVPQRFR